MRDEEAGAARRTNRADWKAEVDVGFRRLEALAMDFALRL
jgi:hypothetical protein